MGTKSTFGLIIGNRGFFPITWPKSGREEMIQVLNSAGIEVVSSARNRASTRGRNTRRSEALRGIISCRQRSHRRCHRFSAEFRRMSVRLLTPAIGEPACAGTHSG